jgi:hypothetical protein
MLMQPSAVITTMQGHIASQVRSETRVQDTQDTRYHDSDVSGLGSDRCSLLLPLIHVEEKQLHTQVHSLTARSYSRDGALQHSRQRSMPRIASTTMRRAAVIDFAAKHRLGACTPHTVPWQSLHQLTHVTPAAAWRPQPRDVLSDTTHEPEHDQGPELLQLTMHLSNTLWYNSSRHVRCKRTDFCFWSCIAPPDVRTDH